MIEIVEYNGKTYPKFQTEGNAARFAIPFAQRVCHGKGYDIGCNRKEWAMPGAIPIDPAIDDRYEARKLPLSSYPVDYIFSSHCLEHINDDWVMVLNYWKTQIRPGGVLFLYLPDFSQEYWRPWNNRKHVHAFTPEIIREALVALNFKNVFVSGVDLNNSFMAMGEV
jgi:predicted SAM-dependent methyltransferase